MASSGIEKSWVVPAGSLTQGGNSYAGAYWSVEWTATPSTTEYGKTIVTFDIWKRGRTVSPTWLDCEIELTIKDQNNNVLYTTDSGRMGSSSVKDADGNPSISFANTRHLKNQSFTLTHNSDGSGSFTCYFNVMIYSGVYHSNSDTGTLDKNIPYYTVSFSANGGTGTQAAVLVEPGKSITLPSPSFTPPTGKHATRGWGTSASGGTIYNYGTSYTPSRTITLYAQYAFNTYTIVYNGNGATGGTTSSTTHTYGTSKALAANGFYRRYTVSFNTNGGTSASQQTAEYGFLTWNTEADGSGTSYSESQSVINLTTTDNATINLYAQWKPASITLPTSTKTDYTFRGWCETSAVNSVDHQGQDPYTPTANITLYAVWTSASGNASGFQVYVKINNAWKRAKS